jgi:small subunit ribosomal protein S1
VKGLRKVKGGLIINCCGIEGFVPVSHLAEEGRGVNPGKFVDETLDVKLLDKDRRKRRLVFSRRNVLEEEMQEERGTFYEDVSEGDVLSGVVTSLTSFGVFVSLGPVEGLVHLSELSWKRNAKPKDLVKKGDEVKVKVIGMDKDENRISLSMKQTMADPWESVADRWNSGDRVEGTVTNLTDFGAFVEIEPGVEGLVHIGDLSWTRIKHPKEVLRKGDTVEVQILEVDGDRRRISLGYKQLHDPWNGVEERYQAGQDLEVKAVRLAEFGVFVELEKGVEGLIHISQLSRERVEKPEDVIAEGAEVTARILEVNPKERRIRLSLSALQEPLPDEPSQRDEDGERPERSSAPRNRDGGNRDNRRPRGGRGGGRGSAPSFPQEETAVTLGDVWGDLVNQKIEDQE